MIPYLSFVNFVTLHRGATAVSRLGRRAALAAGVLVALISHTLLSGRVWFWDLLSPVPPIAYVLLPVSLVIRDGVRRNYLGVGMALLALMLAWPLADLHINRHASSIRDSSTRNITIFNWNTEYWNEEEDRDGFYDFLRAQNADIYQLQEYWPLTEHMDSGDSIREAFPGYTVLTVDEFVTISRFPVISHSDAELDKFLRTDVLIEGQAVSFYNVHLQLHLGSDMALRFRNRSRQMQQLLEDLEHTSRPAFISGDFNATTAMGIMRPLRHAYQDSVDASRAIFPASWSYDRRFPFRLWRVDFAFASDDFEILQHDNLDPHGYSDHGAQRVAIQLQPRNSS